jgi:type IV pilus assembly protein PilO
MDLQDPKVQRMLLSGLLSVLLLYGFFGTKLTPFTYGSRSQEIAQLQDERDRLVRELERARLTVGNMEKLEREFEYLHRQWLVAQTLLPEENEMPSLLSKVTAAGVQAGLEWVRFEPQAKLAQAFYQENPVQVELEGGYHEVGTFLGSVANLSRIVNVRALDLTGVRPEQQADPDLDHTLSAKMEIVAYTMDRSAQEAGADMGGSSQTLSQSSDGSTYDNIREVKDKLNQARREAEASPANESNQTVGGK